MKIFYMNDELEPITVRVNHQIIAGEMKDDCFILQPKEMKIVEIDAPPLSIPYVKRWENRVVLLSYLPAEAVEQLRKDGDK